MNLEPKVNNICESLQKSQVPNFLQRDLKGGKIPRLLNQEKWFLISCNLDLEIEIHILHILEHLRAPF